MKSVKYILDEKWQILLRKAKADLNAATILYRENGISKEVVNTNGYSTVANVLELEQISFMLGNVVAIT